MDHVLQVLPLLQLHVTRHVCPSYVLFSGVQKPMFKFLMFWDALCSCIRGTFNYGLTLPAGSSRSMATAAPLACCCNAAFDSTPTAKFCGKSTSDSKFCIVSSFNSGAEFFPPTLRQKTRAAAAASTFLRLQAPTLLTFLSKSMDLLKFCFKAPFPKLF